MLPLNLPDFDALWDYSHPDRTETRFCEILLQFPDNHPAFLELLTQIARAQGLQGKFAHAHQTLDQVARRLGEVASRPRVRYLLERGRVWNSAGQPEKAEPLFEEALHLATQLHEDFYTVDALHMRAILAPPAQSIVLNRQAIHVAEVSSHEKAREWLGSLYNNLGWAYHEVQEYESALASFEQAEAWQRSQGHVEETRVAVWCAARMLRCLGRAKEALLRQKALEAEWEVAGGGDGYVFEEIAECLLALGSAEQASSYFCKAYETLSRDAWLTEHEPERLARWKELGNA